MQLTHRLTHNTTSKRVEDVIQTLEGMLNRIPLHPAGQVSGAELVSIDLTYLSQAPFKVTIEWTTPGDEE